MKRLMTILFAIGMITMSSSTSVAAMSKSRVRKEARFLTDKMAYELNLTSGQRNDAYEINYDFIYFANDLMDDVLRDEEWAINRYYRLLDIRNDDLRWVLSNTQYYRFMSADYFYRPIYTSGNNWHFRIYITYTSPNYFFFGKPYHYTSYHCGHHRTHLTNVSHYHGRYNHKVYTGSYSVRNHNVYDNHRRSDFSSVSVRPAISKPRESVNNSRPATTRPATSSSRPTTTVSSNSRRDNSSTPSRTPNSTTARRVSTNSSSGNSSTTVRLSRSSDSDRSSSISGSSSSRRPSSSSSNSRSSSSSSGSSRSSSRR